MANVRKDITGETFYWLTAIEPAENYKWLFKCVCGNSIVTRSANVKDGHTKSCGCLRHKKSIPKGARPVIDVFNRLRFDYKTINDWALYYGTTPSEIIKRIRETGEVSI